MTEPLHPPHQLRRDRLVAVFLLLTSATVQGAPVLMISVDGLKPDYVLEAQKRGLKAPHLQRVMVDGVYAEGVIGVWPTITYPSHTTLVTGVQPAEHGIVANLEFDPQQRFKESWFWYAAQIGVPTLWDAAHAAHLRTASIGWPVTIGSGAIDYLIPEFWRNLGAPEELNPSDRFLIAALSRPVDLLAGMERRLGPYLMGNDISLQGDRVKTRYAIALIRRVRPKLMTLHLSSLDEVQHESGPYSPEAAETLAAVDGLIGELEVAAHASDPATVIVVVSDHGFVGIHHRVNLYVPFVQAGLITTASAPGSRAAKIASWRAQPWFAGGMAAIMLANPDDAAIEREVRELLARLAADPDSGIERVLNRGEVRERGGFPDASFLVVFKPGYYAGTSLGGELVTVLSGDRGGHGYSPELVAMRAAFFAYGPGVAHGRNLGVIDMRQVAPTVAGLLGVPLPTAKARPLNLRP